MAQVSTSTQVMDTFIIQANPAMDKAPNATIKVDSTVDVNSFQQVRVVKPEEYKAAALALAHAFKDDEVSMYFVDTPDRKNWTAEEKWDLHVAYMEYITHAHCLAGLVTTVGENYGAVALWIPPKKDIDGLWTLYRSGLWKLAYKLSWEGKRRMFGEFVPILTSTKTAVLGPRDKDSWYLMYIGTRPEARGRGYARKLIENITVRADKDNMPCYLESSNDVNPVIYRKLGFEIVKKVHLKRGPKVLSLDIMVREPVGVIKKDESDESDASSNSRV